MQYDRREIFVPAGRPVEIVFENVDIMPHNLIITSPGALLEVGMAAEAMAARPDAFDRQFIPDSPKVLYASRLLQSQQTDKIQFTAPKVLGDYPYVCTFPGHWRTMFGTMHVVSDLEKVFASTRETDEPPATAGRDFVQTWRMEDLDGSLNRLDADRDFTNGTHLFQALSCSKCHQMNGKGGQVGPDLTLIRDKMAVGDLDRTGLLRELVEPSKVLEKKYQTEMIKTTNGRLFSGIVAYEDARVLRLISNPLEGEETDEVPKDSIAERWQSPVSPMPEGLLNTASSDDILDLIAYVASAGGLQPTVGTEAAAAQQPR
jgi:putative heme-binding domain-containing protein